MPVNFGIVSADSSSPRAQWPATTRFGLRPAPRALAVVEEFLNTRAEPTHDLLADAERAQEWSTRAAHAWARERGVQVQRPELAEGDEARLRDLRARVGALISGQGVAAADCFDFGVATFAISVEGELRWQPIGHGWLWWSSVICGEVLLSQHMGTWKRLKQCRGDSCRVVFYDRSWNNSAALHAGRCEE